jgi:hypothetical protein
MAYLLLLLYIVFIYTRPQEFGGILYGLGVPWLNVIAAGVLVSWVLCLLGGQKKFVKAPQNTLVLGFFISVILSQITNMWFGGALLGFSDMLKNVVLYFFVANLVDSEKKLNVFVWLWVLLTTYIAVQGIIQSVTGVGVGGTTLIEGRIRFIGTFNDPNDVALVLVIVIPFLIAFISREFSFLTRITSLVCLCIVIYGIRLTSSRGGLVSLASVIIFYVYRKFSKLQTVIIGSLIMVIAFFAAPSRMTQLDVKEASAHGRIEGMAHAFWLLRTNVKNYIFGSGYGSIAGEYGYVAHNTIMQVTGENGIIGLFFFLSFIYCSCKSLIMISNDTSNYTLSIEPFASSLLASFIGYIVATFFITRCYNETIYLMVGCAVAIANIAQQKNASMINIYSTKDIKRILFATIGIVIVAYTVVKIYF